MVKPYLFIDFYKTISFGYLWNLVSEPQRSQIQNLIFGEGLQKGIADDWHRGKLSSEQVNEYVSTTLSIDYGELWKLFVQSAESIGVDENALVLIKRLKDKYTTILLTDNLDSLTRFTAPAYKFGLVFDAIVSSSALGIRKSDLDGEIFKFVTKNFNGSVLLDDHADNCEVFTKLGGVGLLVTPENNAVYHLQALLTASSK